MNVPPTCEHVDKIPKGMRDATEFPCKVRAEWRVIDKTEGKHYSYCARHVEPHLIHGHTYSIFPEKDYSKPIPVNAGHHCLECSKVQRTCCQDSRVPMTFKEITGIPGALDDSFYAGEYSKEDVDEFEPWWVASMAEVDGKFYRANTRKVNGDCIFLVPGRGCSLHPRPSICLIYPFWITEKGEIIYEPGPATCSFEREGLPVKEAIPIIGETEESIRKHFSIIRKDSEEKGAVHHDITKWLLWKKNHEDHKQGE